MGGFSTKGPGGSQLTAGELLWVQSGAVGVLLLSEQSSSPSATPNNGTLYTKTDHKLYYKDQGGTEFTLGGTSDFQYKIALTVGYTSDNDYVVPGAATNAESYVNTAMNAVAALGGGICWVQPGLYLNSDLYQIPSGVILLGAGIDSTIFRAVPNYNPATSVYGTGSRRVMLIGKNSAAISNSAVSGITWDLDVANQTGLTSNANHRIIWIQNVTNFRFHNNKATRGVNWTVFFNLGDQIWIYNNIVLGGYSSTYDQNDGIHIRNSSHWWITNNYIDTKAGGGTSGDDAIAFVADSQATQDMTYGHILGNIINGSGSRGIIGDYGSTSFNIKEVIIGDNIIANTFHAGIKLYTQNSTGGIYFGINIHDNLFINIGTNGGDGGNYIRLDKDYGGARKLYDNVKITGNIMRSQNSASNTWYGIDVLGQGNDISICDNTIAGIAGIGGIKVGEPSNAVTDLVCNDNKVNVSGGASGVKGIYLYATTQGTVNDNRIKGHTTGTTYGIYFDTSTANIVANGNSIDTFTYAAAAVSFTSTCPLTGGIVTNIGNAAVISNIVASNVTGINPILLSDKGNVSGAVTVNRTAGHIQRMTFTGNVTFTIPNSLVEGDELTLIITQDGTGTRTVTWPSNFKKAGGTLVLTVTAGAVDVIRMVYSNAAWRETSRALNLS